MGKDFWKFFMASKPQFLFLAKSGVFGKEAQDAADELESELGPFLAVLLVLIIIGLLVYGILSLFGFV